MLYNWKMGYAKYGMDFDHVIEQYGLDDNDKYVYPSHVVGDWIRGSYLICSLLTTYGISTTFSFNLSDYTGVE